MEKLIKSEIEVRVNPVEYRLVVGDDGESRIEGHAAIFNSWSNDLGGFREIINPGAFRGCIKKSDVRALINHDSNLVLGRSKKGKGTMMLREDDKGLFFSLSLPETSFASDLKVSMGRGDIDQCSFGFRVAKGGDSFTEQEDGFERTISKVEELFDVSVVTFPAYPDTSVALRKIDHLRNIKDAEFREAEGEEETSTEGHQCPHCQNQKPETDEADAPSNLENEENAPEYVEPGLMAKYKAKLSMHEKQI